MKSHISWWMLIVSPWNPTSQVDSSLGCRTAFLNWFHCAHAARGVWALWQPAKWGFTLGFDWDFDWDQWKPDSSGVHQGTMVTIRGSRTPRRQNVSHAFSCTQPLDVLKEIPGNIWKRWTGMDRKRKNVHWKLAVSDPAISPSETDILYIFVQW